MARQHRRRPRQHHGLRQVRDNEEVLQRDRDYSACSLNAEPDGSPFALRRLGDERSRAARSTDFAALATSRSTRRRATRSGRSIRDTDLYNFGPLNHYQRPDTRYSLGAMGHYELGEHADVYTQLMFNDYESVAQIAPGGNFFDTNDDQLRQPAAVRAAAGDDRLRRRRDRGRRPSFRCTSGGATSKAAAASSASQNTSFRARARRSWRDHRELGLRRLGAVLERSSPDQYAEQLLPRDAQSARARRGRRSGSGERHVAPVCRSVLDGTDPNCVP